MHILHKIIKSVYLVLCLSLTIGIICSCAPQKNVTADDSTSEKTDLPVSSSEEVSNEDTSSVDTRYRATREAKPDGFKYKNVNIMCVGDSITQGVYFPGGYRYHLYEYLYSNGATFSLVGARQTTTDYRLPERYGGHSGWGGYKIDQITQMVPTLSKTDCDIITIMIGVNDFLQGYELETVVTRYKALLDAFLKEKPNVIIYCCSICPTKPQVTNGEEYYLNRELPSICEEYRNKGYKVYHVDTYNAQGWKEQECFYDGDTVHPNESGNKVIAQTLGDAMLDTILQINDEGDSKYTQPVRVNGIKTDQTELSLEVLQAKTVKATVSPSNAEIFTVLWSSSDEKIATVSNSGKIKGLKKGSATITATSLDGGFKAEIKVTVTSAPKVEYTEIFKDYLNNPDIWEGDTERINNGLTTWFPSQEYTISTKESFSPPSSFVLSMTYAVSSNTDIVYNNNYTSLSYGGFTVKIIDCVKTIELYKDGKKLGTYKNTGLNPERAVYQLQYANGTATLIYGGERIITAKASKPSSTKITITADEKGRCIYASNILLRKINN